MPDANNPQGTGDATSMAEAVDALADLFDEPATDTAESKAAKPAGPKPKPADRDGEPDPGDSVEDEEPEVETDDETSDEESQAGPARDETGRFVSPNAKVKLPDGTTATVAELSQGHLRQSDYTRKTQELSEHRKEFEAERARANETFQQLQEKFQRVNNWLEATRPQRPAVPYEQDPISWGQYNQSKEQWEEAQRYWAGQYQQTTEARKAQSQAELQKYLTTESEALYKAVPAFRDPGKRDAFVTEAARLYADYGLKREEIANLTDHRLILILRDAVKLRRLEARTPQVKSVLAAKPQLIRGSKRTSPTSKQDAQRTRLTERLNQTGSFNDAIPALAHLLD